MFRLKKFMKHGIVILLRLPDNIETEKLIYQFENDSGYSTKQMTLRNLLLNFITELESFKDIFYSLDCKSVLMSGSGSSVFAAFRTEREASEVYEYLKISPSFDIFQAKGIKGWHYLLD